MSLAIQYEITVLGLGSEAGARGGKMFNDKRRAVAKSEQSQRAGGFSTAQQGAHNKRHK
jgi:hypothetical protein